MKEFIRHLMDVLFPDPRQKRCPHCGGGQCLKLCMLLGDPLRPASSPDDEPEEEDPRS